MLRSAGRSLLRVAMVVALLRRRIHPVIRRRGGSLPDSSEPTWTVRCKDVVLLRPFKDFRRLRRWLWSGRRLFVGGLLGAVVRPLSVRGKWW